MTLWAVRQEPEWRFGTLSGRSSQSTAYLPPVPFDGEIPEAATVARHVLAGGEVSLLPATADRPVVARPEHTLRIPPNSTAQLYIGSPLWLQVRAGDYTALDQPVLRPSDTWFGPSTTEGELCYASRTAARTQRLSGPTTHARLFTELTVRNRGKKPLQVDRVSLPMQSLAIYAGTDGRLWTASVAVTWQDDNTLVAVALDTAAPQGAALLAPARATEQSTLSRALGLLLG